MTGKRSIVRSVIALLLQHPPLGVELQPPYRFASLRQPGVPLLVELLQLVDQRPDIATGMLLAHFEGREEHGALQKLATQSLPGDEASWLREFMDATAQLERQTLLQRLDELQAKQREQRLDDVDKQELRALLQARLG